ncbi:unnamed protein product [Bursaphelenchus okinawaensis]|uniref:Uncharacterized protein n=1 Tax=Bursaphelenchus okinawaensis TaxID=465554 RepID=A0A811KU58_9BILA|nr:unnamed protein product [Bursaphelenchus okinawaensis]CAG9111965.1 unnamed protein product [Bursaphelenchus okinawaensis]
MYIISENENLLERLKLLILNSPVLDGEPEEQNKDEATSVLAKRRDQCAPDDRIMILVAKNWDKLMLETISDMARLLMAHRPDGQSQLMIVKKDFESTDSDTLQNLMLDVRQQWCQEWTFQFEKVRKLAESEARSESLKRIDLWTSPKMPQYSIVHFDDPELPGLIAKTFKLKNGLDIKDTFARRPSLFSKPPALHWSHFPRETELQVMFKFTFPSGTMTEPLFRDMSNSAKQAYDWEYDYEWTGGIFFKHELTKVSLYRASDRVVELSGRIDVDEYAAEMEDETQAELPLKKVWPLLSRTLKAVVTDCLTYKTDGKLPYQMNIAFFGAQFFKDINYVDVNGPITARLLDSTQLLGALERTGNIKFGIGKRLVGVDLKQAFPGFHPHTLVDIFSQADLPVSTSRASSSPLISTPVISNTNIVLENNEDDEFPAHTSNNGLNSDRNGTQPGLLGMNITKNRGRRVSFGAIRAIPTSNFPENSFFHRESSLPPVNGTQKSRSTESLEAHNDENGTVDEASVSNFVDKLLKKTMDEVLVMD